MTIRVGGTVITAPQVNLLSDSGGVIPDLMISMCILTPTVASVLSGPQDMAWLRVLILSREPTNTAIREKWLSGSSKIKLHNLYGTTEGGIQTILMRFDVCSKSAPYRWMT